MEGRREGRRYRRLERERRIECESVGKPGEKAERGYKRRKVKKDPLQEVLMSALFT